ncbi:MAG: hypothetical protein AB9873_15660 [Syntrophobacteraceae bacterium]
MSQTKCITFVLLIFTAILIQGCATDKALTVRSMDSASSITAARYNCPQLIKRTVASQSVAMTGVMFGAIGGAIGGAISSGMESSAGKKVAEQCSLPDFGKIVQDAFVERIPQDLPDWPQVSVLPEPISKDHQVPSGYLLAVRVNQFALSSGDGLETSCTGTLSDRSGEIVWRKSFRYRSHDFNRPTSLTALEAENGKLLHEEITFAADKTVSAFVDHLKAGPSK